jgi:acyl-CoA synthetase (AMP-forming)/AMP-acid ligase II
MAESQPWRPAVIFPHSRDTQGRVSYTHCTFRQLEEASNRMALGFQRIGIGRGTRAALMAPPSLDFFALTFALFKLGAIPIMIDPGIGIRNLGKCLAEAGPEAFIGVPKAHAARLVLRWARKTLRINVIVGARSLLPGRTLNEVMQLGASNEPFQMVRPEPGETAAIMFTSGSTGPPKGVVYTHEVFNGQLEHVRRLYGIEPGEIDLPTFPLFALFGPALGMTEVLPDMDPTKPAQVDPVKIIEAIENFGVTNMFGSPAVINRVGRYGEQHGVKLKTLRRVISAGAPVSAKVLQRFAAMLAPGAQVFTPYGATECLPVSSIGSDEILGKTRRQTDEGKGVCVGKPVPGLAVAIVRISDEPIAAWSESLLAHPGEIGEIAVKGPHTTRSYYNRPKATALAKIADSKEGGVWHRMGDAGYLDEQGRIWFCGRKSHRVATGQGTFFTIPCEAVFNTHPSVFRTALVGVKSGADIEPVLCVELEPTAQSQSRDTLRTQLRDLGSQYPHTRPIKKFLFHPAFPVDIRHNAKIFREKLALWAAGRNE